MKAAQEGSPGRRAASGDAAESTVMLVAATFICLRLTLSTNFERPDFLEVGVLASGLFCLALIAMRNTRAGWAVLLLATFVGIGLRLEFTPFRASDVMPATHEATATLLSGGDPYAHDYLQTQPPHSIFPYFPGEIAFYLVSEPIVPAWLGPPDRLAGILIVLLLASLGFVVGPVRAALFTALYGTFAMGIQNSADGGNDTALAFLTCTAIVAGAWGAASEAPRVRSLLYALGALSLGWAVCFKLLSWPIAPFVARWLIGTSPRPRRDAAVLSLVALGPLLAFFVWNPLGMLGNVLSAPTFHQNVWGLNLWSIPFQLGNADLPAWAALIPAVMVLAAVGGGAFALRYQTGDLGLSVLAGCLWLLVILAVSRWTTSSYYTYALTVLAAAVPLIGRLPPATLSDVSSELVGKTAVA
jgi:hypothetical protein